MEIEHINKRLKAARLHVCLEARKDWIYLRAIFPPKPGSKQTHPHQQRIALRLPLNKDGLKRAEDEAKKIGGLLSCKEFSWEPWLPIVEENSILIGEWITRFQKDYMERRGESPITWKTDYRNVFNKLP
jgi:hypothetical protein